MTDLEKARQTALLVRVWNPDIKENRDLIQNIFGSSFEEFENLLKEKKMLTKVKPLDVDDDQEYKTYSISDFQMEWEVDSDFDSELLERFLEGYEEYFNYCMNRKPESAEAINSIRFFEEDSPEYVLYFMTSSMPALIEKDEYRQKVEQTLKNILTDLEESGHLENSKPYLPILVTGSSEAFIKSLNLDHFLSEAGEVEN